jgi:hypothetical protein
VSWLNNGEWLEYTVNPPDTTAVYSISVRVASPSGGGRLRVRLNGAVLGTVNIPNTGGSQSWQTVTLQSVSAAGGIGSQALRLEPITNGFSINWIRLNSSGTNIALYKVATASSLENASYPATNAVDGNPTTRWSSAFSDPQWIYVDLGATYNISEVVLYWEAAYGKSYQIQVSPDATNWTPIYSTTNGLGGTEDLAGLSGTGRYVRMYGMARGTPYGYSLFEFQVFPALAPELSIALSGTNVVLSWPTSATGWSLQAAPALELPGNWSNITSTPFILNSVYLLTNAVNAPAQFYRLEQNP